MKVILQVPYRRCFSHSALASLLVRQVLLLLEHLELANAECLEHLVCLLTIALVCTTFQAAAARSHLFSFATSTFKLIII